MCRKIQQKPNQEIQTERRDSISFTQLQTIAGKKEITGLDQFDNDSVYNKDFIVLHQLYKEFPKTEDNDKEVTRPEVLFAEHGKGSNKFESDFTNRIEDVITITCDARLTGIASVLSHIKNSIARPIAFVSRLLTAAERNYSQLDREALAFAFSTDKFVMYLYGRPFTLITDNRPLTRMFHQDVKLPAITSTCLLRYAVFLQGFNYKLMHRKTEDHFNVDFLSRAPSEMKSYGTKMF
ncbi:hypothetical protein ILUMI_26776 [Ignelater luminosus]|uniref:Reverse transcriptase RNase H-like domain-containing protein n=1 Tax=Ignelater luminosus TaxID=2038154 RepID=A0A8K0FYL8_IGNLU|nr:hypothetical protein ILUMI_26776 [Ignelater luminosus]